MEFNESMRAHIASRSEKLHQVAAELKTELFGIDEVIDRVIEAVRAWYVLPEIITRPVIINLWGLTGTGKTQLTRSLAKKLGFYDRLIEVQMDGFSNGEGNTISAMLGNSGIVQGTPGILVLDEFQRFRTIDRDGKERKVERYMDVWTLLSDGKLAPDFSFLGELEMRLAQTAYHEERKRLKALSGEDDDDHEDIFGRGIAQVGARFSLSPYQANDFKSTLKLKEPVVEIMTWSPDEMQSRLLNFKNNPGAWETDYSKLLIFVSGNLDEMYADMATRVEDCDTDADVFHALTRNLSLIDVKRALSERFKPEQIARLGNNHVIYPSLNRSTYEKLISVAVSRYLQEMQTTSGLCFVVTDAVKDHLYANSVFPAQGTRPVFSSVHNVLSAPLVAFALWALEHGALAGQELTVDVDTDASIRNLVVRWGDLAHRIPVAFEIDRLRKRTDPNKRAVLAVHEAGHGLVYTLLFQQAPREIRINMAAFSGGYNSFNALDVDSRRNVLDGICATLAGRAAEEMVFGLDAMSTGSTCDLAMATAKMANYVRNLGFGAHISHVDKCTSADEGLNTDVESTDSEIEGGLLIQYQRAMQLLKNNQAGFLRMVNALLDAGELRAEAVGELLGMPNLKQREVLENYEEMLQSFSARSAANISSMQRRA